MKKVAVDFPVTLIEEAECVAAELNTNRSNLIRLAVERFLADRQQSKLDEELAAGYIANADLARRISEEFKYADSELI
jgi:metal-responsive CopG/Arc/MetJ family transcriptional regulator